MIINRLWAENVLKYSILRLDHIPEKGLIAVIGDNESGKSSIGESICFALFGRTFSLESGDLDKIIRWGESRCSIKLEFTAPNGQCYQVARFLDELGNHGASISRAGEQPLVRGVDEVQARLAGIIGFGYTEFIESFYLAQREITTPHPHSFAVKAMAGVDALEKVATACEGELEQAEEKAGDTEKGKADIEQQIEALGLDEGYLGSLEAEQAREETALTEDRQQLTETQDKAVTSERAASMLKQGVAGWLSVPVEASFEQRKRQADDLRRFVEDLEPQCTGDAQTLAAHAKLAGLARESEERISGFDSLRQRADGYRLWLEYLLGNAERPTGAAGEETFAARREALNRQQSRLVSTRRTWRILTFTSLLLALVLWGVSGLMGLAPTSPQAQAVADWLQGLGGNWESLALPAFAIAATIMALFFLISMGRGMRRSGQIQSLDRSLAGLTCEQEEARSEASGLAGLDTMPLPRAAEMLRALRDEAIAGRVVDYSESEGAGLLDSSKHAEVQSDFKRVTDALGAAMESVKADAERQVEHFHESIARHTSGIARLEEMIIGERERVRRQGELTEISQSLAEKIAKLGRRIRARKLADEVIEDIFNRLGMEITPTADGWNLTPPSARFDLLLEVDLIAEIGRIHGYENIAVTHARSASTTKAPPETAFDLERAKLALVARGYNEVITYSFVSPELQQRIDPRCELLTLSNPLSADMSVMRTGLWPGLLQTARQNQARQQERVRIFESGLRFLRNGGELKQDPVLAGLAVGLSAPEQWGMRVRPVDFFGVKTDLEAVLSLTGCADQFRFVPAEHPALHPGQTARIERDGRSVGVLGMLHPALASELDIKGNAVLFEVALAELEHGRLPSFEPLSRFPSIRRDLAVVVDANVSYDQVRACVIDAASDLLQDLILFDVYQGEKIDYGRKSLALGLILQASSQTLTEGDVEKTISRVLTQLESELGARLRD